MAENSKIEWTHHTFNPWIGCTKISPACDNCYAAEWDKRYEEGAHWGPHAPRRKTSPANWNKPRQWNKDAAAKGIRYRVFCASLADVFDNHKSIEWEWRHELWKLIDETPNLDWLLLTKRPQNINKYLPDNWITDPVTKEQRNGFPNVWLGTTIENQEVAERNIIYLLEVPAVVRFLSMEPLLGAVDLENLDFFKHINKRPPTENDPIIRLDALRGHIKGPDDMIDGKIQWVITGGESGPNYRPADPEWFKSLRDQCVRADVPFLFKQWEGKSQSDIKLKGRAIDGIVWDQYPDGR